MKPILIVLAVLAPIGCTLPSNEASIFDLPTHAFEGGTGGGTSGEVPTSGVDAATCVVQGNASLSGSLAGTALAAKDAIEIFDATKAKYTFEITDYASACALGRDIRAGSNIVSIAYANTSLASGMYDVTKTAGLSAEFVRYDSTCKASSTETATSGTVTFDSLDECGGAGSFDLTFGSDHVTATFRASVCSVPAGAPACQP